MTVTKQDRDRAHRLGTLAAKAGRGLGGACPYNANGDAEQKALAAVFVRAYVAAGGVVDGLDYGGGAKLTTTTTRAPRSTSTRPSSYRGEHRGGGSYGHLGLPL